MICDQLELEREDGTFFRVDVFRVKCLRHYEDKRVLWFQCPICRRESEGDFQMGVLEKDLNDFRGLRLYCECCQNSWEICSHEERDGHFLDVVEIVNLSNLK